MQSKIPMDGLTKILKICCRSGFFHLQNTGNSLKKIQYGPLGTFCKRNVWREWLSSIVNNTDIWMFPIEVLQSRNLLQLLELQEKTPYLFLPDVFRNYFKTLPLVGTENPWGFAAYGPNINVDQRIANSRVLFNNSLLSHLETRHFLSIIFFCPAKKSSDWFNFWARYRYRWWRKFSSLPSKFSMSDVTETATGDQQISLMMEFPWGKENLETVTLHNESFFKANCQALGLEYEQNQSISTAVIVCQSELNLATFAYLSNSFAEKWRDGEIRKVFQLHVKLAPYKVCISMNGNLEDLKNLKDVAKHLEKELKKCRVAIFPCFDTIAKDSSSQFKRYDEMGVPYTIVLNKYALHSGIAALRSRDTTLEEQTHIAELTPKLLKYLQMKSFDVDEC